MSTDKINRGILLAMAAIGAIAYALLYPHASIVFKVLVPLGLAVLLGLIVRDRQRPEAVTQKEFDGD